MSWLTIVQTVSPFVTGTFGTTLVIIAVAIAARGPCCTAAGAISGGGTILVCASWVVQTFLGAG
jgi:type IV secretory pathway VirB2 component (pilin)